MDAVTYPHPEVIEFLHAHFLTVKLDTNEKPKDCADLVRPGIILWTPLLLYADYRGRVVRQSRGYLNPEDFVAEGRMALALVALLHRRFDESAALLGEIAQSSARRPELAAEALYWGGIAAFRAAGNKAMVVPTYRELVQRFPTSPWAGKAWPYVDWDEGRAKLGV